ncbi:MAG: restriction endonuclease subunit S [Thermodesulfobacteriota bacterium]|nr:restriction endonuclease subunit S [Thermodesulfobacteriota bacterium]
MMLPQLWESRSIESVYDFTKKPRGIVYSEYEQVPFIPMEMVPIDRPYINDNNIRNGRDIRSGNYFEKGDVLLAKITPSFENGKQGIAKDIPGLFGVASTELIPIREKSGISSKYFLFYYLLEKEVRKQITQKMEGTTGRQRIPISVLKKWMIPFPPLKEQEKIAAVLFKIQQAIEVQDSIIEAAQELKKSTMEHVFTHGLRGEKTKETKIGRIPESWETEHLGQKALITAGGTPSRNISAYWKNATIPWVKTSEINYKLITSTEEHITEEGLNNSVAQILPVGTILMAMYGQGVTRGKVALLGIEATTNQACAAIQPYKDINSDFIYYYLTKSYEKLRSLGHGAQQPNLNKQIIQSFTIALPKKDEQKEIADILQAVDKKNKLHTSKTIMLQDLFKTMLNKLMTGDIRVKDLDIDTSCVLEMKNKR